MSELKIKRIDVFQLDMPYSGGVYYLSGGREYPSFDGTFVRITTEDGLEGWGESTPFGANFIASHALGVRAGIAEIAPKLIGLDPRRVDRINEVMDDALVGHEHAKAALDIACWDLFGKSTGLPVCELLGGRTDLKLPIITSLVVCAPDEMRAQVDKYRKKGSRGFSVKIGGEPVTDAACIVEAFKDKTPGEWFVVDANGGLTVEGALRMLRLLPHGLDFSLEAPCQTWRECLSLRRRTNIPIIHDELALTEVSMIQMIADDAGEGINLKLQKFGGLTKARRVRDLRLAAGYVISVQETCGSDIGFAPLVHLSQTIPERSFRCVLASSEMLTVKTADGDFDIVDGDVTAPTAPGLGITPRLDVLGEPVASYF
ncbi:hypothetical protein FDECE_7743 [Fusarium decemcellulare]|nr:hypothetical protein FDECE_7743 [Fusarium decemcellulare]